MTEIDDLRNKAVLPIGPVMELTELSARQIRYYESQALLSPKRNAGNHRMYSLNDVDNLIDIKVQLEAGFNLADIKRLRQAQAKQASDSKIRRMLRQELMSQGGLMPRGNSTQAFGFRAD